MRKLFSAVTASCLALGCVGLSFLPGCESSQEAADRAAVKTIDDAEQARAKAQNLNDLDSVLAKYDRLASDTSLSEPMQILIRDREAQLRLECTQRRIADLQKQETSIDGTISDIEQLAMQVAAAQSSIDAMKSFDPGPQIDKLKAREDAIRGGPDKPTWETSDSTSTDPNAKIVSPTLFAVDQEIAALSTKIAQDKSNIDSARKVSASRNDDSESDFRKAEGETGDQQVADTTAAANAHRDAVIADNTANALQVDAARNQASLERAQSQKASLEAAIASLDAQIQGQQARWADVQKQMVAQQNLQQQITAGTADNPGAVTIAQRAGELATQLTDAAQARDKIINDLNAVIHQFDQAMLGAGKFRNDLMADARANPDSPDVAIWQQMQETLHPAYFNLEKASALQARAAVAAAKARIDIRVAAMFDGYDVASSGAGASGPVKIPGITALLDKDKTGIDVSAAFANLIKLDPDQLKASEDEVNDYFGKTVTAYQQQFADIGVNGNIRRNTALLGQVNTDKAWAQFALLTGDSAAAKEHLSAATDAQNQIDPEAGLGAGNVGHASSSIAP